MVSALISTLAWSILWLLITPGEAFAWGPATHIAIGEAVLGSLHLLPPAIRAVLERNRLSFLYGSVAADISFAKKYAEVGRHSHHWHIGEEILQSADSEALHAVGLGYLSHLAADTVAHNFFVPRRLLLTNSSHAIGHTYWEHRMDVQLGKEFGGKAREVVLFHDHSEADELFDRVLSRTLFSFQTNRRLFRGMIAFQDDERWQQVFDEILRRSRFDLPVNLRDQYVQLAYEYVMDYLVEGDGGLAAKLDPIGEENLRTAKMVRREALPGIVGLEHAPKAGELADRYFQLPRPPHLYIPRASGLAVPWMTSGGVSPEASDPEGEQPPPDRPSPPTSS